MRKRNLNQYCTRAAHDGYYMIYDGGAHYLLRLDMANILQVFDPLRHEYIRTGVRVTPQANLTRAIMRAWVGYLRDKYISNIV